MNQREIHNQMHLILGKHFDYNANDCFGFMLRVNTILKHRGLLGKPMEATARLLVVRDLLLTST